MSQSFGPAGNQNQATIVRDITLPPGNLGRTLSPLRGATSFHTPLIRWQNRIIKRAADIIISLLAIVLVLSWIVPLLALLIRLDSSGPIFFLQRRYKRNGLVFTCIKFRSMYQNAEANLVACRDNDPRITPLGRFLRQHYLDELPQFLNVLWGDMSIIGPRPHMISDHKKYTETLEHYSGRHQVKPGITGLAQIMGYVGLAEPDTMRRRVQLDLFYIRNWSPLMDLRILYKTMRLLFGAPTYT